MQRNKPARELGWNKIPENRRHVYVYALLFLGAVVGNEIKNAVTGPVQNDEPTAVTRAEVSRHPGMKDNTWSLYR